MKKYVLTLTALVFWSSVMACLNTASELIDRKSFDDDTPIELPQRLALRKVLLEGQLREDEKLMEMVEDEDARAEFEIDYAATLIYLGRYAEAKTILEINRLEYPQNYRANVNLGTLYELLGRDEEAYQLIKKAIALNEDSHLGSEWIHLKILDLKRQGLATEDCLRDHFIIFDDSAAEPDLKKLRMIGQQLEYQLIERMTFIREQDPIVGRLLYELGNISARLGGFDEAVKIYAEARRYGFNYAELQEREAFAREQQQRRGLATFLRVHGWQVSAIVLVILLAFTLLFRLIRDQNN